MPVRPTAQKQIRPVGRPAATRRTVSAHESVLETILPVAFRTVPRIWHAVAAQKKPVNAQLGTRSPRPARTTPRLVAHPPRPTGETNLASIVRHLEPPLPPVDHATSGEEPATMIGPKRGAQPVPPPFESNRHPTSRRAPEPPTPCVTGPRPGHGHPKPDLGGWAKVQSADRLGPRCLGHSPCVRRRPRTSGAAAPARPSRHQIR